MCERYIKTNFEFSNESLRTDNVQSGDTEDTLGVVHTIVLVDFSSNRNSRVDRVGDDGDEGLGADLSGSFSQITDNSGVDVEKIVTGHAGLTWDTCGDDDDVSSFQGLVEFIGTSMSGYTGSRVNVGQVSSDTGGVGDIVECQGSDLGVELKQKSERLSDTTTGTQESDLKTCLQRLIYKNPNLRSAACVADSQAADAVETLQNRFWAEGHC